MVRKKKKLGDIHELIKRLIQLASDNIKPLYDLGANTEGFKEGQLVLLPTTETRFVPPNYKLIERDLTGSSQRLMMCIESKSTLATKVTSCSGRRSLRGGQCDVAAV